MTERGIVYHSLTSALISLNVIHHLISRRVKPKIMIFSVEKVARILSLNIAFLKQSFTVSLKLYYTTVYYSMKIFFYQLIINLKASIA